MKLDSFPNLHHLQTLIASNKVRRYRHTGSSAWPQWVFTSIRPWRREQWAIHYWWLANAFGWPSQKGPQYPLLGTFPPPDPIYLTSFKWVDLLGHAPLVLQAIKAWRWWRLGNKVTMSAFTCTGFQDLWDSCCLLLWRFPRFWDAWWLDGSTGVGIIHDHMTSMWPLMNTCIPIMWLPPEKWCVLHVNVYLKCCLIVSL